MTLGNAGNWEKMQSYSSATKNMPYWLQSLINRRNVDNIQIPLESTNIPWITYPQKLNIANIIFVLNLVP